MGETADLLEGAIGSAEVDIFSGPILSSSVFLPTSIGGGGICAVGLEGTDSSSEG